MRGKEIGTGVGVGVRGKEKVWGVGVKGRSEGVKS